MIPVLRMFEVVVATAFYSGICYMIFEGTAQPLSMHELLCTPSVCLRLFAAAVRESDTFASPAQRANSRRWALAGPCFPSRRQS